MIGIWQNYISEPVFSRQREDVIRLVPSLADCGHSSVLSLHKYLGRSPEKYFSRRVLDRYSAFLSAEYANSKERLLRYLTENKHALNQAFIYLGQTNSLDFHEREVPFEPHESLPLVDGSIHPQYVRVLEGVYYPYIRLLAFVSRLQRSKSAEGLDLYNCVEEIQGIFPEITGHYNNLIRNAISHGTLTFGLLEVEYQDRSTSTSLSYREIVALFDGLLDVCNGIALALSAFYLLHLSGPVPEQLLVNELQWETTAPWWRVLTAIPSKVPKGSQLSIFAEASTHRARAVLHSGYFTAALAENYSPGYYRYFLSFKSQKGRTGFAAFLGDKLRDARRKGADRPEYYNDALDEGMYVFTARQRVPESLYKVQQLLQSARLHWPLYLSELRSLHATPRIVVRSAKLHRSKMISVLNAAVLVEPPGTLTKDDVRTNLNRILRKAYRKGRRGRTPVLARLVRLGWARISVFCVDHRTRELSSYGLGPDLICTIQLSRTSRIKTVDLFGSTIEQRGRFRIAWNKDWLSSN
jgi:hypothetical protein